MRSPTFTIRWPVSRDYELEYAYGNFQGTVGAMRARIRWKRLNGR